MDDNKDKKNIFNEPSLPFEDYEEMETIRSDKLRKYVHIKTKEEYAFKTVDKEHINQVKIKNQVTILRQIKDCPNIIRFYGFTDDGHKYYLITEWAENGNLREYIEKHGQNIETKLKLRFAYDIAKGLNFLNVVKVINLFLRILVSLSNSNLLKMLTMLLY